MNDKFRIRSTKHEARSKKIMFHVSCFMLHVSCFMLPASGFSETVERIVAVVGSDIITLYDVERAMAPYYSNINRAPNKELKYKQVRSDVLNRLVDDKLLHNAIEESKIEVTNDDLSRTIRDVLNRNHVSIELLKDELNRKGISFESYKEDLQREIKRIKFINQEIGQRVKISEADMRDYYNKHLSEFGGAQSAHIAQIVLPFDNSLTKAKTEELKARSKDIVAKARSGVSFAILAKEFSKGPNAENGGDLGVIDPALLLPEVSSGLERMKVGEISDPIISPAGIHIIRLIDRSEAKAEDFIKLKERIYNKMFDKKLFEELNAYLAEQRKKVFVEIRE